MIVSQTDLIGSNKNPIDAYHIGTVVDNNDPKHQMRVKVRIPEFLDSENTDDLIWCYPYLPFYFGAGNDYGVVVIPEINSKVIVTFPYKDVHMPFYSYSNPTSIPDDFKEDYPHTYGYKDPAGNVFKVNKKINEITYQQANGLLIEISSSGDLTITAKKEVNINGDVNIKGNVDIKGDITGLGETNLTGNVNIKGDLTVIGEVSDSLKSMSMDRAVYNEHIHPAPGGSTGAPTPKNQ